MEFGGDGHWPVTRAERASVFRDCWITDVAPVHERTELSRRLRAEYAQFSLKTLIGLNGAALPALPAIGWLIGIQLQGKTQALLLCLGFFFSGLCAAVIAALLCYVTLDVDVVRQKAERSAARARIVEAEFPQSFSPEMAAMLDRSIATEKRFWGIGVTLAWGAAALLVLSLLLFIAGGVEARYVLG